MDETNPAAAATRVAVECLTLWMESDRLSAAEHERGIVPLPQFLIELLAEHLAGQTHGPEDLVFTAPQGGPLRERKFLHGQLKPAARRAGLPETLRAHDLRHTAASLLIREGASVKAVQRSLGHKSAVMTLDRYGHLWPDELEDLTERLDRARIAAVAPSTRPTGGPAVVRLRKGQVNDLALWWRWGDSNSRPAASSQGFSERSHRLRFGPGLSGGNAPGS
jgi:Phage integrase family